MIIKKILIIILFFLIHLSGYSQYLIHGYIDAEEKGKTIYLSLLRYNEENAIYPEQVLISTQTDSSGYFEIRGKLLPNEDNLYRIHSNTRESEPLLEFVERGENKNQHNFIFSNTDTLYFPKGTKIWFDDAQSTNLSDKEWRSAIAYESKLLEEYSKAKNVDMIAQAKKKYLSEYKLYCSDSLSGSLVKLLVFAHLRRNADVSQDFKTNPDFYQNLLDELKKDYAGASYSYQYQSEISNLSASVIKEKYAFHKNLNYVFEAVILFLFGALFYLLRRLRIRKKEEINVEVSSLSTQEKKVAKLICEGKSNKEIASELFVSLSTIKSHISNINSKLNVANRKQLAMKLKNHPRY